MVNSPPIKLRLIAGLVGAPAKSSTDIAGHESANPTTMTVAGMRIVTGNEQNGYYRKCSRTDWKAKSLETAACQGLTNSFRTQSHIFLQP